MKWHTEEGIALDLFCRSGIEDLKKRYPRGEWSLFTLAGRLPGAYVSAVAIDLLHQMTATSALLNGVAIPGRSLDAALARYAFNVFVNNEEDETFSVFMRGTGTALHYRDRYLLVCTQHQLEGVDRQKVGMMSEGGKILVTSAGMRHFYPSSETDAFDLVAFDFTEPVQNYPEFRSRFFNLRPRASEAEVLAVLLAGCPYADQTYDIADNNHIGVARRYVVCRPAREASADRAIARVEPLDPLSFDPDGMSGGSAFLLTQQGASFEVEFGGIIARGGERSFYIIKVGVVTHFLDRIAELAGWAAIPGADHLRTR